MNSNKRNYAWTLCPSKSFPGKFYFFNTVNGEAVWSLNEVEKRAAQTKSNYIQRVTDKWHNYPEPDSPPMDDSPNTQHWQLRKHDYPQYSQPFGHSFSNNAPNMVPFVPNVWPTLQVPHPMYVQDYRKSPDPSHAWDPERDMYFQSLNSPKRVIRYEKPQEKTYENLFNVNKYSATSTPKTKFEYQTTRLVQMPKESQRIFGQNVLKQRVFEQNDQSNARVFGQPTININPNSKDPMFMKYRTEQPKTLIKQPIFTRTIQLKPKNTSVQLKPITKIDDSEYCRIPKRMQSNQNKTATKTSKSEYSLITDSACHDMSNLSLQRSNSLSVSKPTNDSACFEMTPSPRKRLSSETKSDQPIELNEGDLRYLLVKRKKSADKGEVAKKSAGKVDGLDRKIKTYYDKSQKRDTPKKRVTFDLEMDYDEAFAEEYVEENEPIEELSITMLRNLAAPEMNDDMWYIVVDTDILLDDFEYIDSFVQSDAKCVLLIPLAVTLEVQAVTLEVQSVAVGDCRGRQRVMAARHLSRKLTSPPKHVAVQLVDEDASADTSTESSILNCCLQAMGENYHVVLVTNNEELYERAHSVAIYCYKLQEIKENATIDKQEVSFELKKIPQTKDNIDKVIKLNEIKNKNLIRQVKNNFNPFAAKSKEFPVNCYRKGLFVAENDENNDDPILFSQNNDAGMSGTDGGIQNGIDNAKINADCEIFKHISVFSADYCENNEEISISTSEIAGDQTLNKNDNSKQSDLHENETLNNKQNCATKAKVIKLKNINRYTLEEHLKRFQVKTKIAEERLKTRMDEWICSFTQIMEESLSHLLQQSSVRQLAPTLSPPWSMPEAVECAREILTDNPTAQLVIEKLSTMLFECSCKKGKLKPTTTPSDFMRILGCGTLLVMCLKSIKPNSPGLLEAESALAALLHSITDPSSDPTLPVIPTPIVTRSEVNDPPRDHRQNYVKSPCAVLQYVKAHYPAVQANESDENSSVEKKLKVLSARAKQIKKLVRIVAKSGTDKSIILNRSRNQDNIDLKDLDCNVGDTKKIPKEITNIPKETPEVKEIVETPVEKETGAKLLKKLALNSGLIGKKLKEIDLERREHVNKELTTMIGNIVNGTQDHTVNKALDNKVQENIIKKGPKLIRKPPKIRIISNTLVKDASVTIVNNQSEKENAVPKLTITKDDNKSKTDDKLDIDALDYSEMDEDMSNCLVIDDNPPNISENNDNQPERNDDFEQNNDDFEQNNDGFEQNTNGNDITVDSGCESLQAYSLAKTFLVDFSVSLHALYQFIYNIVKEFRKNNVPDELKRATHDTASACHALVTDMIDNLKSIIERESIDGGVTMKTMVKNAGAQAANDKRLIRYKQVVTKCLEQTHILEASLRIVLGITDLHCPSLSDSSSIQYQYYNIYE